MGTAYQRSVFINCPFDLQYQPLFEAIVFAISNCGFHPRCSLEVDDGSQIRIENIFTVISGCKLGIHDISATEPDPANQLPRFNMPLELGVFLGAKRYGEGLQKEKVCLILDRDPYRYQKFISDIAGQDIRAHRADPKTTVSLIRNWLRTTSPSLNLPGGEAIWERYLEFRSALPSLCRTLKLSPNELTFADYLWLITTWLDQNP
ncbi:MAG TPA: hypothetical protein VGP73_19740 [Thermoanaerobaculia bacterium]